MPPIAPSSFRRRSKRGGSVDAPPGFFATLLENVSRAEVLARLGLCICGAAVLLVLLRGWEEPFPFRPGAVPPRGVVSRVPFERPDAEGTREAQQRAAAKVRVVYAQDKAPVVRLRDGLKNRVAEIAAADGLARVYREAWLEFTPEAAAAIDALVAAGSGREPPVAPEPPEAGAEPTKAKPAAVPPEPDTATPRTDEAAASGREKSGPSDTVAKGDTAAKGETGAKGEAAEKSGLPRLVTEAEQAFQRFRSRVDTKERQIEFEKAIDNAFSDLENKGVLEKIQHGIDEGSQTEIDVHPVGNAAELTRAQVAHVLLGEAKVRLKTRIEEELGEGAFAERIFAWIDPRLSGSLEIDREATGRAKKEAIAKTPQQFVRYAAGDVLAEAGAPIDGESLVLLRREQQLYDAGRA
jgi:membrane-associated HD superfamily phosphohydrolase